MERKKGLAKVGHAKAGVKAKGEKKVKRWGFVCSPFFFAFRLDTSFRAAFFFAPLSTDYKKTKGLLVV